MDKQQNAVTQWNQQDLDSLFKHYAPTPDQQPKYDKVRNAAKTFAAVILETTPTGHDQTMAIQDVRNAVMIANASIALEGKLSKSATG